MPLRLSIGQLLGGEVSPHLTSTTWIEHGLRAPMRDRVELAVDLIRPDLPGPHPVLLMRTPYDKVRVRTQREPFLRDLAQRGNVIALVDCRGRFNSDGVFRPYFDEADDGYDTVEWIAAQPWCDGNVGMFGGSYSGQNQWFAASRTPPHLKAIAPYVAGASSLWNGHHFQGGACVLHAAEWLHMLGRRTFQILPGDPGSYGVGREYYEALPSADIVSRAGASIPFWDDLVQHPTYDRFWKQGDFGQWDAIRVPALTVTGWWDNGVGCASNFEGMRQRGPDHHTRSGQKLIIGPWPHAINRERSLNGIDFGEHSLIDLDTYFLRFFDHYLRGVKNGIEDEPAARIFLLGANEWLALPDWPPPCEPTSFYLHSRGHSNTLLGHGLLSLEHPVSEPEDCYRYDPLDPVRTSWSIHEGPVDDRVPSSRSDVLCYTSEPLTRSLDVIGWASVRLCASCSAVDTDWHVRLCDVYPDGSARFLCHGVLRARFRESFERPVLLKPETLTMFEVAMAQPMANRFLPGHRIRLEVTSSWFDLLDRNLNTGAENPFFDETAVVAIQRIYHRREMESELILPIVQAL